jgi:hypothetical protein
MCVLILLTNFSEMFLMVRIIQRDIVNVQMSLCQVSVILVRF